MTIRKSGTTILSKTPNGTPGTGTMIAQPATKLIRERNGTPTSLGIGGHFDGNHGDGGGGTANRRKIAPLGRR